MTRRVRLLLALRALGTPLRSGLFARIATLRAFIQSFGPALCAFLYPLFPFSCSCGAQFRVRSRSLGSGLG
ncbi:MAG TPA: hypothetical protein VH025_05855 [Solirubrobacteraceae bacterium]|nr:hypothetical protein [Solirubrobacteraceae bacterium]